LRWIECFDAIPLVSILETIRDLIGEQDLWQNYCHALRNKISKILQPAALGPKSTVG
jgi:hypothetical protein